MSRIFLSHNSADNEITEHISQRLQAAGHKCVFVDYDPELGIAAGKNWEQQLYREVRACHVMIILCSEASMASHWCFAEVTHAKSLGKPVLPVLVERCDVHPILRFQQYIDWTNKADEEIAWKRLERGLHEAGLEAGGSFDWDGPRKPFPGLLSFEAEDAPVFFGRDSEILEGRELLTPVGVAL